MLIFAFVARISGFLSPQKNHHQDQCVKTSSDHIVSKKISMLESEEILQITANPDTAEKETKAQRGGESDLKDLSESEAKLNSNTDIF